MLTRVSTYAIHQRTLSDFRRVQADLANAQRQISSGRKADIFAELAGQVEFYSSIESKVERSDKYGQQNEVIISRLETMNGAVTKIIDATREVRNLIVGRRNGASGAESLLTQNVRAIAEKIASQLNTNVEGRYLFAGSKTDVEPVTANVQNAALGSPDDLYYAGDNVDLSTMISDSQEVDWGVRANEDGFQKLFAAINLAVSGDAGGDTILELAQDMVNGALEDIVAVQARINANVMTLKDANKTHDALGLYWKGVGEGVANADTIALASKVAVDQTILQGSFQVFSTIANLSLTSYLR